MDRQMMSSAATLYQSVMADVINSVRESFQDEGVDENVLVELKNLWQQKLEASKAVDNHSQHHGDAALLDNKMTIMRRTGGTSGGVSSGGAGGGLLPNSTTHPATMAGQVGGGGAVGPGAGTASMNQAMGGPGPMPGGGPVSGQQVVISDPNRLVPVQITIPAQPNNPGSQQRALTVTIQVPAHSLQAGNSSGSTLLQNTLSNSITVALSYTEDEAAKFLQQQINRAFRIGA